MFGKIPNRLIGYASGRTNPEPGYVRDRLRRLRMPWSKEYVPMFVYQGSRPKELADVHTGAWEQDFPLNPSSVVPALSIICRIDIQTVAANKKPVSWFADLRLNVAT